MKKIALFSFIGIALLWLFPITARLLYTTSIGSTVTTSGVSFDDGTSLASGNVSQVIKNFTVASGQSVSVGEVVGFINGAVQKGYGQEYNVNYSIDPSNNNFSSSNVGAAVLSSTQFVVVYSQGSAGKAVIGTISGNAVTYGTAVTFDATIANQTNAVTALSGTQFVVTYVDSDNTGKAILGTVGTPPTFGSAVQFFAGTTQTPTVSFLPGSSPAQFVLSFYDNDAGASKVVIGTVNPGISFGSAASAASNGLYAKVIGFSTTKFVYIYADGAASNAGKLKIGTVASPPTFTSATTFEAGQIGGQGLDLAFVTSSKFAIVLNLENAGGGKVIIGTFDGSDVVTLGTAVILFSGTDASQPFVTALDSSTVIIEGGPGAIVGTISGTAISLGTTLTTTSTKADIITMSSTQFIGVQNSYPVNAYIGNVSGTTIGTNRGFAVGVAKTAGSSGSTIQVIVAGVSNIHSGLTAGTKYYGDQITGAITSTVKNGTVGLAISSTEILLNSQGSSYQFF